MIAGLYPGNVIKRTIVIATLASACVALSAASSSPSKTPNALRDRGLADGKSGGIDSTSGQRPMVVEDLFKLSVLGPVAISPDGRRIAVTVARPGSTNGCQLCNYVDRGDIWVIDRRTGERRNVTRGEVDSSSSWSAVWSPDGRRLAFVSTKPAKGEPKGGDNVRLYVWDARRDVLTRMSERGVHLQVDVTAHDGPSRSFAWLNDSTLLALLLPPGAKADEKVLYWRYGMGSATRAWEKWRRGKEPTASVLTSAESVRDSLPKASLQRIDVIRRSARAIADIPDWDLFDLSAVMQVGVSPDQRRAAVLAVTDNVPMRADRKVGLSWWTYEIGVVALDMPKPIQWAATERLRDGVDAQFAGWAPDSRAFVVTQQEMWSMRRKRSALSISAADGAVQGITPRELAVDTIVWTRNGKLLVYARPFNLNTDSTLPRKPGRWDWWRMDGSSIVNITEGMTAVPDRFLLNVSGDRLIYANSVDGALWELDLDRKEPRRLTASILPGDVSLLRAIPDGDSALVLLRSKVDGRNALLRVVVSPGVSAKEPTRATIAYPSATSRFEAVDQNGTVLAFSDDTPDGVFLWTAEGKEWRAAKRLALNEHVKRIAQARRLLFSYRTASGDSLKGLALLPPGYVQGKRYPLAVWAYGGLVVYDTVINRIGKNYAGTFNLEPLAGRGYVVLFPSIPLPFGVKSDVGIEIPKGVMPAVDRLIEMGVADPEKLAVMGHSFGGYSTYAIITQTTRFKAAVAMSGHPDLLSLYGQFPTYSRYSDRAHRDLTTVGITEYGPFNMFGSPWDDFERYMRNSALPRFDRVETPLMIVHGDMDGAPIQQGEEAFTALYRLGKPVKFLRYWGEGHVVASPANVRHLWSQIFTWLDSNLGVK
jgi:dipeptidyl aminopeptidase/acylaminoacyl peptidase